MIKEDDFIQISAAMVTKLKLSGNNLLVFALIHGFSKDGEHVFRGSLSYISEWLNISKSTVIDSLKTLVDAKYLDKEESYINGVKFCTYKSNMDNIIRKGGVKMQLPYRKRNGGGVKMQPNNNIDIDSINDNTNVLSIIQDEKNESYSDANIINSSNTCADLTNNIKNNIKLNKKKNEVWRTDYDVYKQLVEDARIKLKADTEFQSKQERYFANINYELSIDKGCDYWLSDEGYKKAKSSKGEINMLSRLKNNFDKNKVYNPFRKTAYDRDSFVQNKVNELQKEIDKVVINGQTYK